VGLLTSRGGGFAALSTFTSGGQGIVIAGAATPIDSRFPETGLLVAEPRPDVRIVGNRVLGFMQGIHVAGSNRTNRGIVYRAIVSDNLVQLRVHAVPQQRHGILVGNAHHIRIEGNTVELRAPDSQFWAGMPVVDAIRAHGMFGPSVQIRENSATGTRRCVVAHADNPHRAGAPFWRWRVEDNALLTQGQGVPETQNW
jgi:hypothetical protein